MNGSTGATSALASELLEEPEVDDASRGRGSCWAEMICQSERVERRQKSEAREVDTVSVRHLTAGRKSNAPPTPAHTSRFE